MATVRIRFPRNMDKQVREHSKPAIARDMLRRGINVESLAKTLLGGPPKRIDTGRLRASIKTKPKRFGPLTGAEVGTNVKYARFVHDGTGEAAGHAKIVPGPKGFFAFIPKGQAAALRKRLGVKRLSKKHKKSIYVFSKTNKGIEPNPFLKNAVRAARR